MESFDAKFSVFVECLSKHKTGFALSDVPAIKESLVCAKFDQVTVAPKKKLNGYNLFMRKRMSELKETVTDSNARMGQVSEEWKKLDETEKDGWKQTATAEKVVAPTKLATKVKKERKPQKMSGYQLFVRERMSSLKDVKPRERMTEISKQWKGLTVVQQEEFKTRASLMMTGTVEPVVADK
jgi:hypothetical protein